MLKVWDWFRRRVGRTAAEDSDVVRCTYCGGTEFYEGPSGGMSTNILCAKVTCRHWFNYQGPFGLDDLNRVEPLTGEWFAKAVHDAAQSGD